VEVLRRIAAAEPAEKAAPKVVVGFFNQEMGNEVGKAVKTADMEPIHARTGNDVLRRVGEAADIDAILIDAALPDPGPASLIAQLRADVNVGDLPLILAAPKERLDALRRHLEKYRNVSVIPTPQALDPDTLKLVLADPRIDAPKPLTEAEHQQQIETALRLLAGLASKEPPGYDVQPAADALTNGLRIPKLTDNTVTAVIDGIGRLPGAKPQRELAAFVLDANRSAALRSAAAAELIRHIQQHSLALAPAQVNALVALANDEKTDAALKAKAHLVEGALRPDARATGDRLKDYRPPDPSAGPPPKAPGEDKEPSKDKAPQKDT
jgi:CheY-like chemotaxis protein